MTSDAFAEHSPEENVSQPECPVCDTPFSPDEEWCSKCDTDLTRSKTLGQPFEASREPTSEEDASLPRCPVCDTPFSPDEEWCSKCDTDLTRSKTLGQPLDTVVEPPADSVTKPAPSGPIQAAELVFRIGDETLLLEVTGDTPTTLGREFRPDEEGYCRIGCQLEGRFPKVSRRHAEFELDEGQLFVTDLGSAHGTFVNGERLTPDRRKRLGGEDQVRFGPNLVAQVRLGGSP